MSAPVIRTQDFLYDLPQGRIAQFPLANRHDSKLLVADPSQRQIRDHRFFELPELLPPNSRIIVNDSRVLPARLPMIKKSGGAAEVFLLDPLAPSIDPALALQARSSSIWNCLIGGKKIEAGDVLYSWDQQIRAEILEKKKNEATVRLSWQRQEDSLFAVLDKAGKIPLPPYMKRDPRSEDHERYQTVYAEVAGSVAAPTAGLHFTPEVLAGLRESGIERNSLTLHVGAGTFKPVEAETVDGHEMHRERFEVSSETLQSIAQQLQPRAGRPPLLAVGTTSLRTLESLYWLGVRRLLKEDAHHLGQWEAYSYLKQGFHKKFSATKAFLSLADLATKQPSQRLLATTSLMIAPGYHFSTADILMTNFHQPGSSLILLVAAWAGPFWREIYQHALQNDYRFLSYGDSSLLLRTPTS